jgi:cytochrome c-type biogenesis protein CcmH
MRRVALLLALLGPVAAARSAAAQVAGAVVTGDTALERRTREVAAGLRCPVCQGLSLADSPSELALEMKGLVREQLAAGKSPEEVRAYFIGKYGEWVLLEPKPEGLNLLVYLLPALMLLGGGWFVWRFVRTNVAAKS